MASGKNYPHSPTRTRALKRVVNKPAIQCVLTRPTLRLPTKRPPPQFEQASFVPGLPLTVGRIWKSVPVRHPSSWSRSHWKCLDREPYRRQHERPLFWPTISALGRTRSLSDAGLRLAQCFAVMTSRFRVRTALKTTSLLPLCYPGRKEKRLAFLQAVELFGCGDPQTNPSAQGQDCASAAPGGPRSRTRRSTWVGAFLWRLLSPCNPAAELRIKSPHSANWRHSAATQKLLD